MGTGRRGGNPKYQWGETHSEKTALFLTPLLRYHQPCQRGIWEGRGPIRGRLNGNAAHQSNES
jgi:hypothetical protein